MYNYPEDRNKINYCRTYTNGHLSTTATLSVYSPVRSSRSGAYSSGWPYWFQMYASRGVGLVDLILFPRLHFFFFFFFFFFKVYIDIFIEYSNLNSNFCLLQIVLLYLSAINLFIYFFFYFFFLFALLNPIITILNTAYTAYIIYNIHTILTILTILIAYIANNTTVFKHYYISYASSTQLHRKKLI